MFLRRMMAILLVPVLVWAATALYAAQDLNQALLKAAKEGKTEEVKKLIVQGANVNAKDKDQKGWPDWTVLMYAANGGHTAIVEALLAKGADVNYQTNLGRTALMYAASKGHTTTVQALLDKGANVKVIDHNKVTALHDAALYGSPAIVKILLAKGADINAKDNLGTTPLGVTFDPEVERLLKQAGAKE